MPIQQTNIFDRLKKLFSQGVIVRHIGDGKQLRVTDVDYMQSYLSNATRDRYTRIFSAANGAMDGMGMYGGPQAFQTQRVMLFREYELMDGDPIISSAIDLIAESCVEEDEFKNVLTIECEDHNKKEILNNLFYDILNIKFNLYPWIRNLVKYGDQFLFLELSDKSGIINARPLSTYSTVRMEGMDKKNPQYTYFETVGAMGGKMKMEMYEIAHLRLMNDSNFLPYGKSKLEGVRRVWKQIMLLEDAFILHRISRAPEKRVVKIDVGNIAPQEIDAFMEKLKNKMHKVPLIDPTTGDYNLRYNMMNIFEDFYIPVRGDSNGTDITNLGGLEYDGVEDVEYLRNKLMAGLKIPKAYLMYDEDAPDKGTLAANDIRFAKSIGRVQTIIVEELTRLAIIHLYILGYTDEELTDFKLHFTVPSTILEQEKTNIFKEKIQAASDAKNLQMFSEEWLYKQLFKFSNDEVNNQRDQIVEDIKRKYRYMQLESGISDPAKFGYPQDAPAPEEMPEDPNQAESEEPQVEESVKNVGRPEVGSKYGQDSSPIGRDPLGLDGQYDAVKHSHERVRKPSKKSAFAEYIKKPQVSPLLTEIIENTDSGTYLDENVVLSVGIESQIED